MEEQKDIPLRKKILNSFTTPEQEQSFLELVQTQLGKMEQYQTLENSRGDISFYEVNSALADFGKIQDAIIALYYFAKKDYQNEQEDFDDWFAEKYVEVRNEENPKSITPQKWASAKELEMIVRVKYKQDYKERSAKVREKDLKVSFLHRLMEKWSTHHFTLQTLSKNLTTEYNGDDDE
jgi:hypothetical protein